MKKLLTPLLCALLTCMGTIAFAQTTVSGKVMDPELNEALIGANVIIAGTSEGASTDIDGNFSITSSTPLPWTLEVTYAGYADQAIVVESPQSGMMIDMATTALLGEEVVISASRRREKIQEAPASISVLTARKLEGSPNDNPARSLINLPGVTVQQQSAGRVNIQLRGDGGLFGSATFPILDYRSLSGPGLGTFDALNSALNNVDLERIEVVRGPGSALYGPGVTSGVVHFISKSPIDRPGTTIELIGGELNTFGVSARHATKVSDKFGFKINAVYKKGDEFTLDPVEDADQIAKFATSVIAPGITNGTVDPTAPSTTLLTQADLDPDGDGNMMQDFWEQQVLTATLEFRPSDKTSFNLAGGVNSASAVFYNSQGEGLAQSKEFWTQARLQSGGLFAQVFYLGNDGGKPDRPTFLYQTGSSTRIQRGQLEGQVQYNWDMKNFLNSNWTGGVDYRNATSNTFNQVYGREEEDDDYSVVGAYLQTKLALSPKFDLVVAGRYDQFNFLDVGAFQPRAVMVFKPSPKHTFRFGYNQAVATPTALQVNIDFPVSVPVPGAFDIWLKGNKTALTFDNPVIKLNGLLGGLELPINTPGLPNSIVYGGVLEAVLAQLTPGIEAATGSAALAGAIDNYLRTNSPGGTTGTFAGINIFTGQPLGLIEAPAASLRTEDTWEFGYKGLLGEKLGASLDIYNRKIDGATLFTGISPSYGLLGLDGIGTDLGAAVGNADLREFIFNALGGAGNPAAGPTADLLVTTVAGAFTAGGDGFAANIAPLANGFILGTTPADQLPTDGVTHSAAGYRTFDAYSYWGADFGLEYYASENLSFFGNYSWISENEFNPTIKGVDGTAQTTIAQPLNKYRLGFNYAPACGFRANAAFQHDPSYTVFLGQFSGDTEERNLVDAAVGYKFDNGLSLDVTAQNLFNQEYRYFPNFPKIGRRVLGKLTYTFGDNGASSCDGIGSNSVANLDSDGDGVKDSKDLCPNVAGEKRFKGCPMEFEEYTTKMKMEAEAKAAAAAKAAAEAKAKAEAEAMAKAKMEAEAAAKAKMEADARAAAAAKAAAAQAQADAEAKARADAAAAEAARVNAISVRNADVSRRFAASLRGLQFNTSRSTFKSESLARMDQAVSVLNQYPDINVIIEGHTDSQGASASNMALSESRAKAVMNYLISKGISASRLTAVGRGEESPIADNMTSEGRATNRRVEFIIR